MSAEPHILASRLQDLSGEAVIADDDEVRHLRACEECQTLLRIFVNQRQAGRYDQALKDPAKKSA